LEFHACRQLAAVFALLAADVGADLAELLKLGGGQLDSGEVRTDSLVDDVLADACRWAFGSVAAVINVAFLAFAGERVAAVGAADHTAKDKIVHPGSLYRLSAEDRLDSLEKRCRDERLVRATECLAGGTNADKPRIERVVEHCVQGVARERLATATLQA
jgi:hypothetical protein